MAKTSHRGRVWVLIGPGGTLIEDIDTDQIYHNAHLYITEVSEMGRYALGNLDGWRDFASKAGPGDILVAGRNFGAGSSRQQAVDCFIALKIGAIIAVSLASIYFRNAVNSGLPVFRSDDIADLTAGGRLETGDEIEVDFLSGAARNLSRSASFSVAPMSSVQRDIYRSGNLFAYGRELGRKNDG
jgi:3-isopropylmalate/(R)-2-methylmalate dehydratase small subunit